MYVLTRVSQNLLALHRWLWYHAYAMKSSWKQIRVALGVCLAVAGFASAAEGWGTDFKEGTATAAAENRPVLVEFTGSDWCPPCIHVRTKILPSAEFKAFAKDNHFVLVELDFPRDRSKVTPEQSAEREALSEKYDVDGFPTMILMDGAGLPYGKIVGGANTSAEYISRLQAALDTKRAFDEKKAEAEKLSGTERAQLLLEGLKLLPVDCRSYHTATIEDIIANDPDDVSGFRKAKDQESLQKAQTEEVTAAIREQIEAGDDSVPMAQRTAKGREVALEILKREDLLPHVRQLTYAFVSQSYLIESNAEEAARYLSLAIEADPESDDSEHMRRYLETLSSWLKNKAE